VNVHVCLLHFAVLARRKQSKGGPQGTRTADDLGKASQVTSVVGIVVGVIVVIIVLVVVLILVSRLQFVQFCTH